MVREITWFSFNLQAYFWESKQIFSLWNQNKKKLKKRKISNGRINTLKFLKCVKIYLLNWYSTKVTGFDDFFKRYAKLKEYYIQIYDYNMMVIIVINL